MIGGHEVAIGSGNDTLVEGMGNISSATADLIERIGHRHIAFADRHGHAGLMVISVAGLIHLMTGTDIKHPLCFRTVQRSERERTVGVRAAERGLSESLPGLRILDDADDFRTIVIIRVVLSLDEEVIGRSRVESAELRKFQFDRTRVLQRKGGIVIFDHDACSGDILDTGKTA